MLSRGARVDARIGVATEGRKDPKIRVTEWVTSSASECPSEPPATGVPLGGESSKSAAYVPLPPNASGAGGTPYAIRCGPRTPAGAASPGSETTDDGSAD